MTLFPSPYAWNAFDAENVTSLSPISSTRLANVSTVYGMFLCTCTTPLGKPVLPELYSQNAWSSGFVGAGSSCFEAEPVHASQSMAAGTLSPPATITCCRCGQSPRTWMMSPARSASTMTVEASLSRRKNA